MAVALTMSIVESTTAASVADTMDMENGFSWITTSGLSESDNPSGRLDTLHTRASHPLDDGSLGLTAFYLIILVLTTIVGNVGNVLVIGAVITDKRLRKEGNILIMNLAVADLCVTAFVDPFSIAGVFVGKGFWEQYDGLCHVIGSICLVSCVCSLWSIAAISINRFVLICKQHLYHRLFTKKKTIIICLVLWLGAFMLDLPNFLGWGDHTYDMKTMACSYDRLASYSYTAFFIAMFVAIPLCTVLFCNIRIYAVVLRSKIRVASHRKVMPGVDAVEPSVSTYMILAEQDRPSRSVISSEQAVSGSGHPQAGDVVFLQVFRDNGCREDHPAQTKSSSTVTMTAHPAPMNGITPIELSTPDLMAASTGKNMSVPASATETSTHQTQQIKLSLVVSEPHKKKRLASKPNMTQEIKLAKTLFIIFIVFCVCWTPYGLLCLIDRHDLVAKDAYAVAVLMAHSSSSLNSVLYAATNKGFRDGYKVFLASCGCRCIK